MLHGLILIDLGLGRLFTGQQECDQTADFLGFTQTFGRVVLYELFGRRLPVIRVNLFE